ncbi:Predicted phosphohydrolase or phosphomutase, AlkP superfamily [Natronoarchaeum philippinense]|uniref:Predicted phosphohydrolase or phosphomutase, AlkP superfamily n=1 Tax=Natronoarchaeum philippinense TaxID=558529 RepID=A0A285NCZ8_NATPI|nr:alkaline phosphatase family protein [Natronoarchaeum philippinense]SNZ06763.1 Predicted phosphohydrolase or phosphomutase, AlkP superfamily [Natronoarchaeum philippinense]
MTVYVVGLDGADWSLLRPWIEEGRLPAFARVVEEGVSGDLESTLPPVTFPAWKCYSTGKTPGKLGVYEWFAYDRATNEIGANDASDFRSLEYWDVLADEGRRAGVVNMPTTHPASARQRDGADGGESEDDGEVFLVAGSPASERKELTKPTELKAELLDAVPEYRVKPDLVLDEATPGELVAEATALFEQRFDAATWLADEKDCEVVHTTLFATDTLQHRLWDRPEKLRDAYERIDELLGDLLDRDDAEAVVLMSDHGFQKIDEIFLVNQWLLDRGDLAIEASETRDVLSNVGLTEERLKRVVDRLGLVNLAQSLVPESVQRLFPSESGRVAIQDADIDWDRTKAVSLGRGPIYLNRDAFGSDDEADRYAEEIAADLEALETPAGEPVAAAVHDPTDVYTGEMPDGPDLLVEYGPGVDAPEAIGGDVFGETTEWLATHRRSGVFAAWGEEIAEGDADLQLYDLAPTLLHYLDTPVPEDADGDVRVDVLTGGPAERDVLDGPPSSVDEGGRGAGREVEETLRELGYME